MKGRLCSLLTLAPLLATANVAAQEPVPTLPDENEPPPRLAPREPPSPEPEPALVVVAPAPSPRAPRYGAPGEVAITNGFSLGGYYTTYDGSQARYGSISFDPAIDWFIVRNLFVGFEGTLSYAVSRGYGADSSLVESDYTTVGGGFRLGYAIPLGEHVSLVPRVTLGVESVHATQKLVSGASSSVGNPLGLPTTTSIGPSVSAFVPILVHPVPHFFLGIGPSFFHNFARTLTNPDAGGQQTTLAVHGVVGVWWGGDAEASTEEAPAAATRTPFGKSGQTVLDGSLGVSVYGTNYANTSSSATTWSVSPGFDHFVADRVSLGLAIPFGGSHFEELAPPTTAGAASLKVTTDTFTFALAPRVGVDLPLSNAVSFYPRANIAFGLRDEDEKTNAAENKHSVTIVSIGLSAPLLFHFAEHAFVGFGPSVYHELSAKTDDGQDVTATSVGANLFVGGWL